MSCVPAFSPGLDFDCVKDIIADVRSGAIGVVTVQKALWVAGSAVALFQPAPVTLSDKSLEEVAEDLDKALSVRASEQAQLDPATIIMIIQLVWKLLQQYVK